MPSRRESFPTSAFTVLETLTRPPIIQLVPCSTHHHATITRAQAVTYLQTELDLAAVRRRFVSRLAPTLCTTGPIAERILDRIADEYRRLLVLKYIHADTHGRLFWAPEAVTAFWEAHVVDTAAYKALADRLGLWLHYNPDPGSAAQRRLETTLDCYAAQFGTPAPSLVWGSPLDPPPSTSVIVIDGDSDDDVDASKSAHASSVDVDRAFGSLAVLCSPGQAAFSLRLEARGFFNMDTVTVHLRRDVSLQQLQDLVCAWLGVSAESLRIHTYFDQVVLQGDARYLKRDFGLLQGQLLVVTKGGDNRRASSRV